MQAEEGQINHDLYLWHNPRFGLVGKWRNEWRSEIWNSVRVVERASVCSPVCSVLLSALCSVLSGIAFHAVFLLDTFFIHFSRTRSLAVLLSVRPAEKQEGVSLSCKSESSAGDERRGGRWRDAPWFRLRAFVISLWSAGLSGCYVFLLSLFDFYHRGFIRLCWQRDMRQWAALWPPLVFTAAPTTVIEPYLVRAVSRCLLCAAAQSTTSSLNNM